jgi:hypothetical protein
MTKLLSCIATYHCQRCNARFEKEVGLFDGVVPFMEIYADISKRVTGHKCDDLKGTHWANVGIALIVGTRAHEE